MLNWERLDEFVLSYEGKSEIFLTEQVRETMLKPLQTFFSSSENGAAKLDGNLLLAERYLVAHVDKNPSKNERNNT